MKKLFSVNIYIYIYIYLCYLNNIVLYIQLKTTKQKLNTFFSLTLFIRHLCGRSKMIISIPNCQTKTKTLIARDKKPRDTYKG
jgi:hypothetical protein